LGKHIYDMLKSSVLFHKLILWLVIFLITNLSVYAQITFSGNVLDQENLPIRDVYVLLLNSNDSSLVNFQVTDAAGKYIFKNQFEQLYIIQFSHTSYQPYFIRVPAYSIENYTISPVQLTERMRQLEEVVITDQSPMKMNVELQPFFGGIY
jgi:hypothetical protein